PSPSIAYIAFYSDVEHEVLKVTSGHRATITYNRLLRWLTPKSLHQQNVPAAVRLCGAVAIDRHRHTPLVHSAAHRNTAARLVGFLLVYCAPVESVLLYC